MQMRVPILTGLLMLAACASGPTEPKQIDPNDAVASMEGQASPDGSVIVCRKIKKPESRFMFKECKSEKVWAQFDAWTAENAKTALDKIQRNGCGGSFGRC